MRVSHHCVAVRANAPITDNVEFNLRRDLEPGRYAAVAAFMLALVAVAAYVPARRATGLDLPRVLRAE